MTPTPCNDLVLVEVLESEVTYTTPEGETIDGAIAIASSPESVISSLEGGIVASLSDKLYKRARVLQAGPGKPHPKTGRRVPLFVEPGDLVVYAEAPDRSETPNELHRGQRWMTQGGLQWHSGDGIWPGPGDLALITAGCIVVTLDADDRIEFPARFGGDVLPDITGPRWDPREAGGRFNEDSAEGVAERLGSRW